jgi:EAL domain-containing protein (putative c-di-GMP-specific phosphodiesterase class I)
MVRGTASAAAKLSPGSSALPTFALHSLEKALHTVRSYLGMDVAFVSEFVGDRRFFRHVDTRTSRSPIKVGESSPLDEGYCKKIVDGVLPELIPDTAAVPEALEIPATREVPIGSHLSVPLRLADGKVYGTVCCFSFHPDVMLNERDLHLMKAFAELIAYQIETSAESVRRRAEKVERIQGVLRSNGPRIVYQPIFLLHDNTPIGAESLSRFPNSPQRGPDQWFAEASEVGLETELELKAIRNALSSYQPIFSRGSLYLSLNSSPRTIIRGRFLDLLEGLPPDQIVLEITEHDYVEDYAELRGALAPLRTRGIKLAVDDAGSGYASMRHILNLQPDVIKLDVSLTRGIDADKMRRALASALIEFAQQTNCQIVAEGIETKSELEMIRSLGVHAAQGYYLSKPLPIEELRRIALNIWSTPQS